MTDIVPQFEPQEWKESRDLYEPLVEFNVVTFNMLAPCYKRIPNEMINGRKGRESDKSLIWNKRATDTVNFFEKELLPTSSIVALQEFWLNEQYSAMFENSFRRNGFEMRTLKRSGSKMDAVVIAIKSEEFEIKGSQDIYLCSVGDRVALLLWLCHRKTGKNFLVANTHLSFPHNVFDRMNQMRQMRKLTDVIDKFSIDKKIGPATRIVTGDFNSEVESSVCDHLRLSGYKSSFEICPPMQSCDIEKLRKSSSIGNNVEENGVLDSSEVSSQGITLQQKVDNCPSMKGLVTKNIEELRSESVKRFVSHRTHTDEDLGVDHIFIKPEERIIGQDLPVPTRKPLEPG
jgi:hypothetical protein